MSDDPERTAAISDAFHDGFGTGIGHVEDEMAERVAAAEARGYDRAVANLRDRDAYMRWARNESRDGRLSGWGSSTPLTAADYLDSIKEQP